MWGHPFLWYWWSINTAAKYRLHLFPFEGVSKLLARLGAECLGLLSQCVAFLSQIPCLLTMFCLPWHDALLRNLGLLPIFDLLKDLSVRDLQLCLAMFMSFRAATRQGLCCG